MKLKLTYITFILIFLGSNCFAQEADSLIKEYEKTQKNAEKYRLATEIGNLLREDDSESALFYFGAAKNTAEKSNDNLKVSEAIKNIGIVYYLKDDFNTSSEYYFKALSNLDDNDTSHFELISKLHNNIAWNFERIENYDQAEERYNNAIAFAQKTSNKELLALIYNNLGVLYKNKEEFDKAIKVYERSYEINISDKNVEGQVQNLNNIGYVYLKMKKHKLAFNYVYKALILNYEMDNKTEVVNNLENIGRIYIELRLFNAAKDSVLKAFDIAKSIDFTDGKANSLLLLSRIEEKLNNIDTAFGYFKEYHILKDSIYRQEQNKFLLESETKYQTLKKEKENEVLKRESLISDNRLRQSIIGLILAITLTILLFLLLSAKHRANKKLDKLNKRIQSQNEEIENQSEELKLVNEEVSDRNKELNESLNELKSAQRQLIQSEKMASLGILSAGIAHEINNPLNFISGGVETMLNHIESYDKKLLGELKPYTEIVDEGIKRAVSIVKSLGSFSRHTVVMDEECDIHNIIDNCLVMLYNKTKQRIDIEKVYSQKGVIIAGNVGKLHQVFLNLLSNAEQAIKGKGTITIKTERENSNVIIYITDTGEGISDKNKSKINDPFFTTKEPGSGTGLGLSITYNIIQEHRGNIDLESKENLGTTFIIKLPIK